VHKFQRMIILTYPTPVNGQYRFQDRFQLLPADEEAPRAAVVMAHHPATLEFRLEQLPSEDLPQGSDSSTLAGAQANAAAREEITLLLSALTKNRFFMYRSDHSWFVPAGQASFEPKWGQPFYWYPLSDSTSDFIDSGAEPIHMVEPAEYYGKLSGVGAGDVVSFPSSLDEMLSRYFSMETEARESFLSACRFLDLGYELWPLSKSLSFVSLATSLETLIHYDHREEIVETCPDCGQPRYRVMAKFRDFIDTYVSSEIDRKGANQLYKIRSEILHRGKLLLLEKEFASLRFDAAAMDQLDAHDRLMSAAQSGLVNWLSRASVS